MLYIIQYYTMSWYCFCVHRNIYVLMSGLDDKDILSAEQWQSAVKFMTSAVQKEIRSAGEEQDKTHVTSLCNSVCYDTKYMYVTKI